MENQLNFSKMKKLLFVALIGTFVACGEANEAKEAAETVVETTEAVVDSAAAVIDSATTVIDSAAAVIDSAVKAQ
jgi:hypothetical protein